MWLSGGEEEWCKSQHRLWPFSAGQGIFQGALGNLWIRGNLKMSEGKTSRLAVLPVHRWTHPGFLVPRLSWAHREPWMWSLPIPSSSPASGLPSGFLSLHFSTLLCPAWQSCQGQRTNVMLAPDEIFTSNTGLQFPFQISREP